MTYRVNRVDNQIEKKILTGLIVSDGFLKEMKPLYNPDMIMIPFVRIVAKWCFDYYDQFEKAPGIHVQDLFESYKRNAEGADEQNQMIEDFLASLSDEYEHAEHFNIDYLMTQAEQRFESRNQIMMAEDIIALNSRGEIDKAQELIVTYKRIQRPTSTGVNPYSDKGAIQKAFAGETGEILMTFPGALRYLLGNVYRHDFISLMGRAKIGKTWWLQKLSDWFYKSHCNTAMFECGDMGQDEMIQRVGVHNTGKNFDPECIGPVDGGIPVLDCRKNQDGTCTRTHDRRGSGAVVGENVQIGPGQTVWVECKWEQAQFHVPCTHCLREQTGDFQGAVWHQPHIIEKLDWEEAYDIGSRIAKRLNRQFKLSVHPNDSINVAGIESQLDVWEATEGFIPDVVIIDYADILAPEHNSTDTRRQINDTWKALRRLGQKRHCAVITATQADAASYEARTIREKNFSENRQKYDHVTRVVTLNQTDEEKERRVMRLGTMFVRAGKFDARKTVTVLQCLEAGAPYLGCF